MSYKMLSRHEIARIKKKGDKVWWYGVLPKTRGHGIITKKSKFPFCFYVKITTSNNSFWYKKGESYLFTESQLEKWTPF